MIRRIELYDDNNSEQTIVPLANDASKIQTRINPIDREHANSEIEKDEVVLDPELKTLYVAGGKRHSRGGTPVNLKPGTFIFSDFNKLKIDNKQQTVLNLKKLSKAATPASLVKSNINIKEHNKYIETFNNPKQDFIAKNSAESMLNKNLSTLGDIAYAQESKKGFPEGLPELTQASQQFDFSLRKKVQASKQYKYGGFIEKYAEGAEVDQLAIIQNKLSKNEPLTNEEQEILAKSKEVNSQAQTTAAVGPASVTTTATINSVPTDNSVEDNLDDYNNKTFNGATGNYNNSPTVSNPHLVGLTNRQKQELAYRGTRAIGVKTQLPFMARNTAVTPIMRLRDVSSTTNPVISQFNSFKTSMQGVNPVQSQANLQEAYSKSLDNINQATNSVEDYNSQVSNQNSQQQAATQNQVNQVNNQNYQKYYDDTLRAKQNADDLKSYFVNDTLSTRNEFDSKLSQFNSALSSQRMFKTKNGTLEPLYLPISDGKSWNFQINPNIDLTMDDVASMISGSGIDDSKYQTRRQALMDQYETLSQGPQTTENIQRLENLYRQIQLEDKAMSTRRIKAKGSSAFMGKLGGYKRYLNVNN